MSIRKSRAVMVVVPLVAAAAIAVVAFVVVSSAQTKPHACHATAASARRLIRFEGEYNAGIAALGHPKSTGLKPVIAYLERATVFFRSQARELRRVGTRAPRSLRPTFNARVDDLTGTAAAFASAAQAAKSAQLTALKSRVSRADTDANRFSTALQPLVKAMQPLIKECS